MNKKISSFKFLISVAMALAACLTSTSLFAKCRLGTLYTPPLNIDVHLGYGSVPADAIDGYEIGTLLASTPGLGFQVVDCNGVNEAFHIAFEASRPAVSSQVFESGVRGVGYKLQFGAGSYFANSTIRVQPSGSLPVFGFPDVYRITLVKTGPITPGTYPTQIWGTVKLTDVSGAGLLYNIRVTGGNIRLEASTCNAVGPQTVNLGRISTSTFGSDTTTGEQSLTIPVTCSSDVKVFAKLSGVAPPGTSVDGLVKNSGTATGVAVQFLDGNKNPIKLGTTQKQPRYGGETATNKAYYAYVRAYKIDTVTAGSIEAQATLTLTYD